MYDVKEKDWKIFRKKIIVWQENYMKKLNNEYIKLLQRDNAASCNFWDLEKRIFKDKRSVGVVIDMRRSTMIQNILELLRDDIIQFDDLNDFSEELKNEIKLIIDRW
jgi:hypothetical protein